MQRTSIQLVQKRPPECTLNIFGETKLYMSSAQAAHEDNEESISPSVVRHGAQYIGV